MDLKKIFVVGTLGFIVICLGLFYRLSALSPSNKNGMGMVGENPKVGTIITYKFCKVKQELISIPLSVKV